MQSSQYSPVSQSSQYTQPSSSSTATSSISSSHILHVFSSIYSAVLAAQAAAKTPEGLQVHFEYLIVVMLNSRCDIFTCVFWDGKLHLCGSNTKIIEELQAVDWEKVEASALD